MRNEYLQEEYKMRDQMNYFEKNLKELVNDLHKYSLIEFYHNEIELQKKISLM